MLNRDFEQVLEVFLHDPLYKWALSPEKLQHLRPTCVFALLLSFVLIVERFIGIKKTSLLRVRLRPNPLRFIARCSQM